MDRSRVNLPHAPRTPTLPAWLWPLLTTLVAAILRLWALDRVPPGYHYDEAFEGLEAWKILQDLAYRPIFFAGNFGVEPTFIYLTAGAFALFGAAPTVQRSVAALVGTLAAPLLYALGRELEREGAPPHSALLAAWSLAISYWHLTFSRVGIEPILVPTLLCLVLWAFWRGLRRGGWGSFLIAGAAVGFGPYTYPAGRLIPLLYVILLVWLAVCDRARWRAHRPRLLISLIAAAVVFAPLAWFWANHPDLFLLRSRQVTVVGSQAADAPLTNVARTLGMFSVAGDADPRSNLPGRPALDWFIAPWLYLGSAVALARWRRPAGALPLSWGVILLLPTIFSDYAPHFRRAVGATPAIALLIGLGAAWLLDQARAQRLLAARLPSLARAAWLAPGLALALIALTFLGSLWTTARDYFVRWGNLPDLYYAYDVGLWDLGRYAASFPEDRLLYLTPRPAAHTTLAFAWRGRQAPITFDGRAIFPFLPNAAQPQHYLVIEHEDFRTALLLHDLFPAAEVVRDFRDRAGALYARHYLVPAGATPVALGAVPSGAAWPGATLHSYTLLPEDPRAGGVLYVRLFWSVGDPAPAGDWTTFLHLFSPDDPTRVIVGADARPGGGSYPTQRWRSGQMIVDEYQIPLPGDLSAGVYAIALGFYMDDGQRLPVRERAGEEADHIVLSPVQVSAP